MTQFLPSDRGLLPSESIELNLKQVATLRASMQAHPEDARDRDRLRQWQAQRLAYTYADLLESKRYAPAARYFLTDLYGPGDSLRRDADLLRIMPMAERVLPHSGLEVLAKAIELDALSEELDYHMVMALRRKNTIDEITPEHYLDAFLDVGERSRREHQLTLVIELGETLDRLARKPLAGTTLRLVSGPAHLAGLGELFSFVERGYQACRHMGRADAFLATIAEREHDVIEGLFASRVEVLTARPGR